MSHRPLCHPAPNISTVYNNLTDSQTAYPGWSLEKTEAGKQVTIPSGDLQSWNVLAEYAKENNKELGTGNPDSANDSNPSVDDKVESALQSNTKEDPGKIALQALTGVFSGGIGTSLSGIIPGQAGTILGNVAATAAGALAGIGLGAGAADSLVSSLTGGVSGGISDATDLLKSLKNVLTSGSLSEAGAALLDELGEVAPNLLSGAAPDSFSLTDTYDKANGSRG